MQKHYLKVINSAIEAGNEIIKIYNSDNFEVSFKDDNSPLTAADKKANDVLMKTLVPTNIPIISEENKEISYEERKMWEKFWLVDPLDGTKEFIKRRGDFTVNVALIEKDTPIFGVIYVPAKKKLYFGGTDIGSFKMINVENNFYDLKKLINSAQKLPIAKTDDIYRVIASKSHFNEDTKIFVQEIEKKHRNTEIINVGSSLKICAIADGTADIYPRYAPTMEWDIAAGHAIIKAAGGKIIQAKTGKDVVYNKENLLNPYFVASM